MPRQLYEAGRRGATAPLETERAKFVKGIYSKGRRTGRGTILVRVSHERDEDKNRGLRKTLHVRCTSCALPFEQLRAVAEPRAQGVLQRQYGYVRQSRPRKVAAESGGGAQTNLVWPKCQVGEGDQAEGDSTILLWVYHVVACPGYEQIKDRLVANNQGV